MARIDPRTAFDRRLPACVFLLAGLLVGCAANPVPQSPSTDVRHVLPDDATGTSQATVVSDVPLAYTGQFFGLDENGTMTGATDLRSQFATALRNLQEALALAGASPDGLAKLNVYLAEDVQRSDVLPLLSEHMPAGARPAVTFVAGVPARPDALVSIDAVAVAPERDDSAVWRSRSDAVFGRPEEAHVAVLPPGEKLFISGQAARGDLVEATAETMRGLLATLAYQGSRASDVVQVKVFANEMTEADTIETTVAQFFSERPTPPVVVTEWRQDDLPVEIEIVAAGDNRRPEASFDDPVSYVTPPWMSAIPVFSRSVEVHFGELVFVSGLYPSPGIDDRGQVEELFDSLGRILSMAGSDFAHLVKATYYNSSDEAGRVLSEVRRELYDPERPPAASKIDVRSVGLDGAGITMDMIAVVPQ